MANGAEPDQTGCAGCWSDPTLVANVIWLDFTEHSLFFGPFPHTTYLQQTTLTTTYSQTYENAVKIKEKILDKVENTVKKRAIDRYVQFLCVPQCF